MGIVVYDRGDVLHYPRPFEGVGKELIVYDRNIDYYKKTGKYFIRYLYENLLEVMAEDMHDNIADDMDNIIAVVGGEGVGKSTMIYNLLKVFKPDFKVEDVLVRNFSEFIKKAQDWDANGGIYWFDEATEISNNRDWMRDNNKQFIKILEKCRSKNGTLILAIPSYDRLDIYLRECRVRYIVNVQKLAWERNHQISRGYFHLTKVEFIGDYRNEIKVGYGKFKDIDGEDREHYRKTKAQFQDDDLADILDNIQSKNMKGKNGPALQRMIYTLRQEGRSVGEIADITGLTNETVMVYASKEKRRRKDAGEIEE